MDMNEFRELDERLAKAQGLMRDIDKLEHFLKSQNEAAVTHDEPVHLGVRVLPGCPTEHIEVPFHVWQSMVNLIEIHKKVLQKKLEEL